uniref:Cyclin-dependent kinase inhibitor n=1 Tax=Steinernema glaseri TaxID=37863 RepID=A0A1I7Z9X5_9BILA
MGCHFSKTKRRARVQPVQGGKPTPASSNVTNQNDNAKSVEASGSCSLEAPKSKSEEGAQQVSKATENMECTHTPRNGILRDPNFMNPNEGVETAQPVRARTPEPNAERTQSDEREPSPPKRQEANVREIIQQGKIYCRFFPI